MELNQISQLLIKNLKFFSNELLKQEDIPVLIDIIQPVNIGSDGSSQLPPVGSLEIIQTRGVSVNVL